MHFPNGRAPSETDASLKIHGLSYTIVCSTQAYGWVGARRTHELLQNINFTAHNGGLTYVIGPTGSGKTTLFDVISGRVTTGYVKGIVLLGGHPIGGDLLRNVAYVRQTSTHIPTLTVKETLEFIVHLRFGSTYTELQRKQRVEKAVAAFGLRQCYHSMVGDGTVRGISGGERKRLSLALEMMHEPTLVLLDEPTTGLDATTALQVATVVSDVARDDNRTVLASLHQPFPEVMALATKLVVLSCGRLVYCGPPSDVASHFTSPTLGFIVPPVHADPAQIAIAVVSGACTSSTVDTRSSTLSAYLADAFERSPYCDIVDGTDAIINNAQERFSCDFGTSFTTQTSLLLWRMWVTMRREPGLVHFRLLRDYMSGLLSCVLFWGQGTINDGISSSYNNASMVFSLINTVAVGQADMVTIFERNLMRHESERWSGLYSTTAFWAAQAIAYLPLLIAGQSPSILVLFLSVGGGHQVHELLHLLVGSCVISLVSLYLAMLLTVLTGSAGVALALHWSHVWFLLPLAGFEVPVRQLPEILQWASALTYTRWGYQWAARVWFRPRQDYERMMDYLSFNGMHEAYLLGLLCVGAFTLVCVVLVGLLYRNTRRPAVHDPPQLRSGSLSRQSTRSKTWPSTVNSAHEKKPELEEAQGPWSHAVPSSESRPNVLLFKDLRYRIKDTTTRGKTKDILHGVSGCVRHGEMCAVMGTTGSGKTTLLDLLAYRKTSGFVSGEYYVYGSHEKPLGRWCSYVQQDDVHIPVFTVYETLKYAALLRLGHSLSRHACEDRARAVMAMLGLGGVADVIVGDAANKGISGGQLRKLSIGVEMVSLSPIVLLDECTSGLDEYTAHEVMAAVRALTGRGYTIVCAIHAPSRRILQMFDSLVVIDGGYQAYFGPVHEGANTRCLRYAAIPVCSWDDRVKPDILPEELYQKFQESREYVSISTMVSKLQGLSRASADRQPVAKEERFSLNVTTALVQRQCARLMRMKGLLAANILGNVTLALLHGFSHCRRDNQSTMQHLSLFKQATTVMYFAFLPFIPSMFQDRLVYYRERGAGVYGPFSQCVASNLPFVPLSAIFVVTYGSIVYNLTKLRPGAGFVAYFMIVLAACNLCGMIFCRLLSFAAPTPEVAEIGIILAYFLGINTSGYVVRLPTLPPIFGKYASKLSFIRWVWEALILNEFEGNMKIRDYQQFRHLKETVRAYKYHGRSVYKALLEILGFLGDGRLSVMIIIMIFVMFKYVLCYVALRFISYEKK